MERELWRLMMAALKCLPRTCGPKELYTDADILAIVLWAALHDRSINWACQRENWPMQAWRRSLPDQSTVSRRTRRPSFMWLVMMLVAALRHHAGPTKTAILDGRPLELGEHTTDREARQGRGAGRYAKGYKLHTLIDFDGRILAWHVTAMSGSEPVVARRLLKHAVSAGLLAPGAVVLADAGYDSNPLHRAAAKLGVRVIAPRKRPGTSLSKGHRQEPGRLLAVYITECLPDLWERLAKIRGDIERFFGAWSCTGGGLHNLPPWARGLHRVRRWVAAKVIIHTTRIALRLRTQAAIAT